MHTTATTITTTTITTTTTTTTTTTATASITTSLHPQCQGYGAHWDASDLFVLQVEGSKQWDLYPSLSRPLALFASGGASSTISSEALAKAEGERVRVTLQQGETSFLYVPRGTVHVCTSTGDDAPSVHVTISATTTNTWLELFQRFLPPALHRLATKSAAPSLLRQVKLSSSLAAIAKVWLLSSVCWLCVSGSGP
jgi:ribosomal protein L16 Arg81 hydroxylase